MSIATQLQHDSHAAMRAGDKARLGILRMALAAIKQREVDTRSTVDDAAVLAVLEKMIKQGRDSMQQYAAGGRLDLVEKETFEIDVLEQYLPARLGDAEVEALIAQIIAETGAASPKDIGKVMNAIKTQAAGRIDMAAVNVRVRAALNPG